MPYIGANGTLFHSIKHNTLNKNMSTIYYKDTESSSVVEARRDRERLTELNIRSPDVGKMFKLRIDRQTMFYFRSKDQRSNFIAKYYSRRTKKYSFEKKKDEEEQLNN